MELSGDVWDISRELQMTPDGSRASTGSLAVGRMFGKKKLKKRNQQNHCFYDPNQLCQSKSMYFQWFCMLLGLWEASRCLQMAPDVSRWPRWSQTSPDSSRCPQMAPGPQRDPWLREECLANKKK